MPAARSVDHEKHDTYAVSRSAASSLTAEEAAYILAVLGAGPGARCRAGVRTGAEQPVVSEEPIAVSNMSVRISRYRVLRQLGQNHLARVYLAAAREATSNSDLCSLEILREEWTQDEELRTLFLEQAAQTLPLEHPNVVSTLEIVPEPDVCGRVTSWSAGQPLTRVLERAGRGSFPLALHLRILCEVLSALHYLHGHGDRSPGQDGLVHRDTSPDNVLITYEGQVKLLGAGFERSMEALEQRCGHLLTDLCYASPELCLGYPVTPSSDVYAVGVMLWEALTGARRTFGGTFDERVRLRTSGEEPDVQQFQPAVPQRLAEICRRALCVSPRERYADALELSIDLESFLSDTETDAQQRAGLHALGELMQRQFAAERSEILLFIESQRAEAEPLPLSALGWPARESDPEPDSVSMLEDLSSDLEDLEELPEQEALASELPPAVPALPAASAVSPKRDSVEPETSGHRAYSSTVSSSLRPPAQASAWLSRATVPAAILVLLLLVVQGAKLLRRPSASTPGPPLPELELARELVRLPPPSLTLDTTPTGAGLGREEADAAAPPSEFPPAADAAAPLPAFLEPPPLELDPLLAAPLVVSDLPLDDGVARREGTALEPPKKDALATGHPERVRAPRPAPESRRSKRKSAAAAAEARARAALLPRALDETDPYGE
jgi:serine/threonine protein kinase